MTPRSVPDLLGLDHFEVNEGHPHIEIDQAVCAARCTTRPCLTVCPADVYTERDGQVMPDFAACLECGTCVVACLPEALSWHYPDGGFGVTYRYG